MISALASADPVTWISICVKALVYATTLLAMGSILSLLTLRKLPAREVHSLKWIAVACAIAAAVSSLARLPLRASFLMGGTWQGATEPMMLAMVWDSPLGTSIAIRLVGLGLILLILVPGRAGRGLAGLGAIVAALSFVFRGHALEEPRVLLGALITLHVLGVAFWIGAFAPLYRIGGEASATAAGTVAHEFGRQALWVVGILTGVGAITLWLLTGNILAAIYTPYGQIFALKLAIFAGVMGFAAWNKLRLTPALLRDEHGAGTKLRQSVRLEAALIGVILLTTAALTTVSAPEKADQGAIAIALNAPNY
jgi:putative copper resistance protein D